MGTSGEAELVEAFVDEDDMSDDDDEAREDVQAVGEHRQEPKPQVLTPEEIREQELAADPLTEKDLQPRDAARLGAIAYEWRIFLQSPRPLAFYKTWAKRSRRSTVLAEEVIHWLELQGMVAHKPGHDHFNRYYRIGEDKWAALCGAQPETKAQPETPETRPAEKPEATKGEKKMSKQEWYTKEEAAKVLGVSMHSLDAIDGFKDVERMNGERGAAGGRPPRLCLKRDIDNLRDKRIAQARAEKTKVKPTVKAPRKVKVKVKAKTKKLTMRSIQKIGTSSNQCKVQAANVALKELRSSVGVASMTKQLVSSLVTKLKQIDSTITKVEVQIERKSTEVFGDES